MTTRETLKSFLNKINKNSDRISYKVNPASGDPEDVNSLIERRKSDLGIDPNTELDLLNFESKKSLLNDYLSDITSVNEYSISGGVSKGAAVNRGMNLSEEAGENNRYVNDSVLKEKLSSYSNSNLFSNLNEIVDKTSKNFTNHNLLKDVPGVDLDTSGNTFVENNNDNILLNAVDSTMNAANRFSSKNKAYSAKGTNEEEFEKGENSGSYLIQNEHGKFNKRELKYTLEELKNVGLSMLYKSSGYDTGTIPGESIHPDDLENENNEGGIRDGTASPDYVSNGKFNKQDFNNLRAINAATAPNKNDRPFNEDRYYINLEEGNNTKTFGTTFNSALHFDGKNKNVLIVKASIACKAVVSIAMELYDTVKKSITNLPNENNPDFAGIEYSKNTTGPFFLGKTRGYLNSNLDLIKNSVVAKTKYNYTDCIDAGIKVFFGDIKKENLDSKFAIESPGYLLSICLSSIKGYQSKLSDLSQKSINSSPAFAKDFIGILRNLKENQLIKFLNVLAVIGDKALESSEGNKNLERSNNSVRNVDSYKDLPGNRVGKFRKKSGRTKKEVAWNQGETPSSYILPVNVIRASSKMSQGNHSPNVVKAMLGSGLYKNTYLDVNNDGYASRIPQDVVKEMEDRLDAEYVPFYIQDLRTNEIISFHAFLSSLSDTLTPNFNSTPGYGRMDPVQIYSGTNRSVTVSFTLVATNKQDFDEMWYKINKITTLVYPQWSQGTKVSNKGDNVFIQPFSQVIGASPIVRLRVGDVIKSNYSRFNFARIFGIGDPNIKAKPVDPGIGRFESEEGFLKDVNDFGDPAGQFFEQFQEGAIKVLTSLFGSPMQLANIGNAQDKLNSFGGFKAGNALQETISTLLTNGFVNPLLEAVVLSKFKSPNTLIGDLNGVSIAGAGNAMDLVREMIDSPEANDILNFIGSTLQKLEVKANTNSGYRTNDGRVIYLSKKTKVSPTSYSEYSEGQLIFKVLIDDFNSKYNEEEIYVQFSDFYFSPEYLFRASGIGNIFYLADGVQSFADEGLDIVQDIIAKSGGAPGGLTGLAKNLYKKDEVLFMDPQNNPYVQAYESTKGRGLAGVLGGLTFDWLNQNFMWETDHGSRAPLGCKMTFNLQVIHDIPPGMDHSGFNRAPLYNVGGIMNNISGDPYEDGGAMSKFRYKTGREDKKSGE